ncbi:MAG: mechanosensitive ion channel [Myxococcales bacterium]|nr:mechanosensitive ion channel [Myxococcales bacterium]MCB9539610.1 mechanosensitive ion channel [Myxococcales bacterium]
MTALTAFQIATAVLGLTVAFLGARSLTALTGRRLARVRGRGDIAPVPTDSPLDDAESAQRKVARESIQGQTRALRRLLGPTLLGVTGVLVALPYLEGAPAAVVSLTVGALTVVVGVAARPVVENLIAGVVIAFSKVLNIGDTVIVGEHYGTVEALGPTHTTIKVWDWRRFVVPNTRLLGQEFQNLSLRDDFLWAYIEFTVPYEADLQQVEDIARKAMTDSPFLATYEPPAFWVYQMKPEGAVCWLAGWADSPSDAWSLRHAARMNLIAACREAGISLRFTQQVAMRPPAAPPT